MKMLSVSPDATGVYSGVIDTNLYMPQYEKEDDGIQKRWNLLVMNWSKKLKTRCNFLFRILRLDDRADNSHVDVFSTDIVR